MRTCNLCLRPLRWDENLSLTRVETTPVLEGNVLAGGTSFFAATILAPPAESVHACPDCHAAVNGLPPPAPRFYPKGQRVPQHPQKPDSELPICGLCRRALPEDDTSRLMRLRGPELDDDDRAAGIQPMDAFKACRECIAKYRPRKLAFLKRLCRVCDALDCTTDGHFPVLPETATERNVAGDMLT